MRVRVTLIAPPSAPRGYALASARCKSESHLSFTLLCFSFHREKTTAQSRTAHHANELIIFGGGSWTSRQCTMFCATSSVYKAIATCAAFVFINRTRTEHKRACRRVLGRRYATRSLQCTRRVLPRCTSLPGVVEKKTRIIIMIIKIFFHYYLCVQRHKRLHGPSTVFDDIRYTQ